tara:strand:+ start:201 stop:479 length:279 start_codon:yes stop_codon:yes gene_type:complete
MSNDKLEKYEALDFINEQIISDLEKKLILHKKLFVDFREEIKELKEDLSKSSIVIQELLIAKDDKRRRNHELRNKLASAREEIRELKRDIKQ